MSSAGIGVGVGVDVCGQSGNRSRKELTEQVNLDARELGAFPLGKRRFGGWVEARWGNSE